MNMNDWNISPKWLRNPTTSVKFPLIVLKWFEETLTVVCYYGLRRHDRDMLLIFHCVFLFTSCVHGVIHLQLIRNYVLFLKTIHGTFNLCFWKPKFIFFLKRISYSLHVWSIWKMIIFYTKTIRLLRNTFFNFCHYTEYKHAFITEKLQHCIFSDPRWGICKVANVSFFFTYRGFVV